MTTISWRPLDLGDKKRLPYFSGQSKLGNFNNFSVRRYIGDRIFVFIRRVGRGIVVHGIVDNCWLQLYADSLFFIGFEYDRYPWGDRPVLAP